MSVIIPASHVWDSFQNSDEDLMNNMIKIAEKDDFGIEVFMTENFGIPRIVVVEDGVEIEDMLVLYEGECERIVSSLYDKYLTNAALDTLTNTEKEISIDDKISEREEYLDNLVFEFISEVSPCVDTSWADFDDIISDVKEHFLEYLARKHDIKVYRPMYLEYQNGDVCVSDYPYEEMLFEDNNSIYK